MTAATIVTADMTVYAHWSAIPYDVVYSGLRGASNPNPATYTIEDSVTFANPGDVPGYRFTGWSPSCISRGSTGNKTITAQRSPIAAGCYAVEMAIPGAAEPMSVPEWQPGKVYKLPLCMVTPPAGRSRFVGWRCSNGKRYDDGMLVFNLANPGETVTMTAIWE